MIANGKRGQCHAENSMYLPDYYHSGDKYLQRDTEKIQCPVPCVCGMRGLYSCLCKRCHYHQTWQGGDRSVALYRLQPLRIYLLIQRDSAEQGLRMKIIREYVVLYSILFSCLVWGMVGCNPTESATLSVDRSLCTGCAACVAVCESDAIRIISNKAVIDPTKCTKCGNCVEMCPENAVY